MKPVSLIVALSESAAPTGSGPLTLEHTILREGEWKHPKAPGGRLVIDKAMLSELQQNFQAGVGLAKDSIPFHVGHTEHVDDRAAAWAGVKVVPDEERPGKHKMVASAHYTTEGDYEKVRTGQYAFVSPTIDYGYTDRESGSRHKAVLRNVALTNYPFIKQMGPAKVVNLSEIATEEGDAATVELAAGFGQLGPDGLTGSGGAGSPNPGGLPDGYDQASLPNQCRVCARLGNDCPFAAEDKDDDLSLKTAAAQSGNCPQYVEADGQTPGAGGAADAASAPPPRGTGGKAAGKQKPPARVPMNDVPNKSKESTLKGQKTMTPEKYKQLQQQLETVKQEKHDTFLVALGEKHGLPADALNAITDAFKTGFASSVALSDFMDGQSVALSENEVALDLPASVTGLASKVDLSDSVILPRQTLRDLMTAVASSERTQLKEDDTREVEGKPSAKSRTALSEFEGLTPAQTVEKVNAAAAAGKI